VDKLLRRTAKRHPQLIGARDSADIGEVFVRAVDDLRGRDAFQLVEPHARKLGPSLLCTDLCHHSSFHHSTFCQWIQPSLF
jgi:hypothetical protein